MEKIIKLLKTDKLSISHNKNPIKMEKFLKFLKCEVMIETDNLGYLNGWRERKGNDDLIIKSGIVDKIEYLNSIQYKKNLGNPWNNYVNPFYLFDILTEEGKSFFIKYYQSEIDLVLKRAKDERIIAEAKEYALEESVCKLMEG